MVFNRRSLFVVLGSATLLVFFNNCAGGNFETFESASSSSQNGAQGVPGAGNSSTTTTLPKTTTTTIKSVTTTTLKPGVTTTTLKPGVTTTTIPSVTTTTLKPVVTTSTTTTTVPSVPVSNGNCRQDMISMGWDRLTNTNVQASIRPININEFPADKPPVVFANDKLQIHFELPVMVGSTEFSRRGDFFQDGYSVRIIDRATKAGVSVTMNDITTARSDVSTTMYVLSRPFAGSYSSGTRNVMNFMVIRSFYEKIKNFTDVTVELSCENSVILSDHQDLKSAPSLVDWMNMTYQLNDKGVYVPSPSTLKNISLNCPYNGAYVGSWGNCQLATPITGVTSGSWIVDGVESASFPVTVGMWFTSNKMVSDIHLRMKLKYTDGSTAISPVYLLKAFPKN